MSNNDIGNMSMTVDRTIARGMQFTPVCVYIGEWLSGTSKSIALPITFTEVGIMNFASNPQKGDDKTAWVAPQADYRTYTFTELKPIFASMVDQGREFGGSAFVDKVPSHTNTRKAFATMFSHTYTVSKGDNEGQVRNLVAHAMANVRNAHKRIDASNLQKATVEAGKAWYVEGDEKCIAYTTEKKARKAWARHKDNYGANWYTQDKADRLAEAKVYQQAEAVGKVEQVQVNTYTLTTITTMPAIQVCKLAKNAGAPKEVHTGTGAKNRCIAWFATDVKRLTNITL